jgi:DtxR family Mn-dependent transcriptional regulator
LIGQNFVAPFLLWLVILAVLAAVLAPTHGVLSRLRRHRLAAARERMENALKHLLHQASEGHPASLSSLQGALRIRDRTLLTLTARLEREGLIRTEGAQLRLTPDGERLAVHVLRAHRLWEAYLADEIGVPLKRVHAEAERAEHRLTPTDLDRLSASMGHPEVDPHGDPIPRGDGEVPESRGTPLERWPAHTPGRIVHLEDEPPLVYAELTSRGLHLGQVVRVIERLPDRIVLADDARQYRLAPALASNVYVTAVREARAMATAGLVRLSELAAGARAEIVAIDPVCRGVVRRRLLDLGFTPGTEIRTELSTFAGDPRAYRLRGTSIALRHDQADRVFVKAVA